MSDVFADPAVKPATSRAVDRSQRYLILSLMVASLAVGIAIGAVVTRGAFADPDNRISMTSDPVTPDALSTAFARAAEVIEPAVVSIDTREGGDSELGREGKGSGVLVTSTGYILTNYHVVEGATSMKVKLADRRELDGKLIGKDEETDLAVVKIEAPEALPFARFGDSNKLRVGDWVLAIGSPFGLEQTVTAGIISARERETNVLSSAFQRFLQTDAAINPGNSGGPLVNLAGEVVGINTQIATRTGAFSGIGLALPSQTAVEIYNQLITSGRVSRGFLGIQVGEISAEIAKANGLENTDGVLVAKFSTDDSPALKGGLQPGDVITELNGEVVKNGRDLIRRVGSFPAGTIVKLTYVRQGQPGTATVKLTDRAEGLQASVTRPQPEEPRPEGDEGSGVLGISVRTLSPDLARERNLDGVEGALVLDVAPGSEAARGGLRANDVVTSINGTRIASAEEYEEAIAAAGAGDPLLLGISRRVGTKVERRYIAVTAP